MLSTSGLLHAVREMQIQVASALYQVRKADERDILNIVIPVLESLQERLDKLSDN